MTCSWLSHDLLMACSWLTDWLTDLMTIWLTDLLNDILTDLLTHWLLLTWQSATVLKVLNFLNIPWFVPYWPFVMIFAWELQNVANHMNRVCIQFVMRCVNIANWTYAFLCKFNFWSQLCIFWVKLLGNWLSLYFLLIISVIYGYFRHFCCNLKYFMNYSVL